MSLAVDVLVTEHKLILRAVEVIRKETAQIEANTPVNPNFIITLVDFFRTYADKFHHGKEEGILFKELAQKKLNKADQDIMNELILEHVIARRTVTALENANKRFLAGNKEALREVLESLTTLVKLYPSHIEKEDRHFFYPSMQYFSEEQRKDMLASFLTFNRDFTDKRYKQIIDSLG